VADTIKQETVQSRLVSVLRDVEECHTIMSVITDVAEAVEDKLSNSSPTILTTLEKIQAKVNSLRERINNLSNELGTM